MAALPPGPAAPAIVQGLRFVRRPVEWFDECRDRYGDPFTIRLPSSPPVVLFSDPAAIRDIFTGDDDALHAGEATIILRPILGANSVLLLDGARHLHQRRMMMPPFHGDRMRAYGATMRDVTERALATWPVGTPFPLMPRTQAITLDVIMRTVFGLSDGATMSTLRDRLRFVAIAVNPLYLWPVLQVDLGPLSPWGRFQRLRREIDRLLGEEIATRRATDGAERTDVLSLLLAARDEHGEPMGETQLRDELMTLLLAGHETTATALAWTMHRILTEPDVLARVRGEIAAVAGDGGRLAPEDVGRLEYLDAVVKETMRLNPVIPDVMRIVKRPMRIGGIDLPAGVGATPNIHAAHRRPETWPDPLAFRPERFLGTRPSPYEYFPFGGGVRRCLGMAFALYEMKIVLATLLARADFAIAPGYGVRVVRRNVTWVPSEGMPVVVTRRAA